MSDIKTWIERCEEHPDHQSGMISDGMIRARMCEEIADLRAEIERLRAANKQLVDGIDTITRRKQEEIERLREALVLGSEVLASHQGSPQREWHSGGAWLYPGDSINVVRAPLPEISGRAMTLRMRVFVVLENDRGCGPMVAGVFASLEAAQEYLRRDGRSSCYLYSEEGEDVQSYALNGLIAELDKEGKP
jgi:hypothetical protein